MDKIEADLIQNVQERGFHGQSRCGILKNVHEKNSLSGFLYQCLRLGSFRQN